MKVKHVLCGKCANFQKNGCKRSFDIIYNTKPVLIGNCLITRRLRNELNRCDLTSEESLSE